MRRNFPFWRMIIVSTIVAFQISDTNANTLYVATNSLSNGPGTSWTNAFFVIQDAVNIAGTNDTIMIKISVL